MSRWNWTWEESPRDERSPILLEARGQSTLERPLAAGAPREVKPPAAATGGAAPPRRPDYRRRRAGAALALVALVVLVVSFATSGGHSSPRRHPLSAATAASRTANASTAASEPTPQAEEQAIDRVLAYTPAVMEGAHKGHEVALTFDDGPGPYTQRLVATLNALHVHATFFAIGEMERYFSDGTRLEVRSGEAVENHTETHPMLASMPSNEQHEQILDQMLRMELLGAPRPRLFRPPYGSFNATTFRQLHTLHLLTVLWSTDTQDFRLPGVQAIVQSALAGAHPGAIILMHDGGGDRSQTIAALPAIVRGLRARGLRPVTVPQLLVDDPPSPGQSIPTSLSGD